MNEAAPAAENVQCYVTEDLSRFFTITVGNIEFPPEDALLTSSAGTTPADREMRRIIYGQYSGSVALRVGAQLFSGGNPLCLSCFSGHILYSNGTIQFSSGKSGRLISFPVLYSDLPDDTVLVITLYEADVSANAACTEFPGLRRVGCGRVQLFDRQHIALAGTQLVQIATGVTPEQAAQLLVTEEESELQRLRGIISRMGRDKCVESVFVRQTLSVLASQRIGALNRNDRQGDGLTICVDFPEMPGGLPLVHTARLESPTAQEPTRDLTVRAPAFPLILDPSAPADMADSAFDCSRTSFFSDAQYSFVNMLYQENAEEKERESTVSPQDARPIPSQEGQLLFFCKEWPWCINFTTNQLLEVHAPDLPSLKSVWRYRYWLQRQPGGLIPLVWSITSDSDNSAGYYDELERMLRGWSQRLTMAEVLTLLLPQFAPPFCPAFIRDFAIERLDARDDSEFITLLNQLVQAARWDALTRERTSNTASLGPLSSLLVRRGVRGGISFATRLYWLLHTEINVIAKAMQPPGAQPSELRRDTFISLGGKHAVLSIHAEFLFYQHFFDSFVNELQATAPGVCGDLMSQQAWIATASKLVKAIRDEPGDRPAKIQRLRDYLSDQTGEYASLTSMPHPVPLPTHPEYYCDGISVDDVYIFKSAQSPIKFALNPPMEDTSRSSSFILKIGDDVRQDQLVQQLFSILSNQVNRVLDMRLRLYSAMSLEMDSGLIEIVPNSQTVQEILLRDKTIARYLRDNNDGAALDAAQENYVRSCAGYTVLTYLFGIGDRHLENLMMQPDGHFFHIDFGFILGRDPKPFPPKVKFSKEMLDHATDRADSLMSLALEAFNQCRKYSPLVLTLFRHMRYSRIKTIEEEAVSDFTFVVDRLYVNRTDAEAARFFHELLNEARNQIIPKFFDSLHIFVQTMRT